MSPGRRPNQASAPDHTSTPTSTSTAPVPTISRPSSVRDIALRYNGSEQLQEKSVTASVAWVGTFSSSHSPHPPFISRPNHPSSTNSLPRPPATRQPPLHPP